LPDSNVAVAHHALQHHFDNMEQQREASSLGMWIFLATEIMFFGGLMLAYLIYRLAYWHAFAAGSQSMTMWLGAVNTAVLICSSLTVALSVHAAQEGHRKLLVTLLLLTMLFGFVFLGIKSYEYYQKYEEHHVPGAAFHFEGYGVHPDEVPNVELFFCLYFIMTGLHALHMIIGLGLFTYLTYKAYKGTYGPDYHTPVENFGLYWHFVDIVWIFLFPLLYLVGQAR
jgi:cytochrome c oxidase subunit III